MTIYNKMAENRNDFEQQRFLKELFCYRLLVCELF